MLRSLINRASQIAIEYLGGTTRDKERAAIDLVEQANATASTLAGAIDDAVAMAYDAHGQCRDCCRGIGRGHADYCGIAMVLAPLIGTARTVADRQHERAVEIARAGRAEAQA